jgi:hypothetical protein
MPFVPAKKIIVAIYPVSRARTCTARFICAKAKVTIGQPLKVAGRAALKVVLAMLKITG